MTSYHLQLQYFNGRRAPFVTCQFNSFSVSLYRAVAPSSTRAILSAAGSKRASGLANYQVRQQYLHTQRCIIVESRKSALLPNNDDVIKWKHFPHYWPFVRRIHRSPVNSPHKGQWRGALMFSLICARINDWVNNHEAGDLRRRRAHYDVTVMDNWCNTKHPHDNDHLSEYQTGYGDTVFLKGGQNGRQFAGDSYFEMHFRERECLYFGSNKTSRLLCSMIAIALFINMVLTLIPALISEYSHYIVWDENTYPISTSTVQPLELDK